MTSAGLPTWRTHTRSPAQTAALGRAVARVARAGDLLALTGELGAGKTQFVRGLAEGLRVQAAALASPTFVMIHEYPPADPTAGTPVLVHVDAYRLRTADDVESVGGAAADVHVFADWRSNAVVVVEWADRIADLLDEDRLEVHLEHVGESERLLRLSPRGRWSERWAEVIASLAAPPAETIAGCPTCRRPVPPDGRWSPFCSERCKLVDLHGWLTGRYAISRPLEQRDVEQGE